MTITNISDVERELRAEIARLTAALAGQPANQLDDINVVDMPAQQRTCPTCEALARTVMLDQTSHDALRKPLTNEQIGQAAREAHIAFCLNKHQTYEHALTRAIEAAHGIKENT